MTIEHARPLDLDSGQLAQLADRKVTCPFVGSLVAGRHLTVSGSADNPLGGIEELRRLGNSGGGDLGDLLVLFAAGNHMRMRGADGRLDRPVPLGFFSLEFPGSQGSHRGHSGILQGDPEVLDSGRFSGEQFERLAGRARNGLIKRSELACFIAENLAADVRSKVFDAGVAAALAGDLLGFVETVGPAWLKRLFGSRDEAENAHRDLEQKLTKLLGEDNLVGAAGEFGLLFAFLDSKPGAARADGEAALEVADLVAMFVDKRLPDGWERWRKTRLAWVRHTTALLVEAGRAYHASRST